MALNSQVHIYSVDLLAVIHLNTDNKLSHKDNKKNSLHLPNCFDIHPKATNFPEWLVKVVRFGIN